MKSGVFVDIGAHDGKTYSNTLFFEKELDWTGICVEPLPHRFKELSDRRNCVCVQGCVSNYTGQDRLLMITSPFVNTEMLSGLLSKYDPRHLKRVDAEIAHFGGSYEVIDVDCYLFNDLMDQNGITHINFLSIDTEGGELDILKSIDWSRFTIDVIAVEDNYSDNQFVSYLRQNNYYLVQKLSQDLIFARNDIKESFVVPPELKPKPIQLQPAPRISKNKSSHRHKRRKH
jgi:FkbM family methyltransferase